MKKMLFLLITCSIIYSCGTVHHSIITPQAYPAYPYPSSSLPVLALTEMTNGNIVLTMNRSPYEGTKDSLTKMFPLKFQRVKQFNDSTLLKLVGLKPEQYYDGIIYGRREKVALFKKMSNLWILKRVGYEITQEPFIPL